MYKIDWSIKQASWNRFKPIIKVGPTIEVIRNKMVIIDGIRYPIPDSLRGKAIVMSTEGVCIGGYKLTSNGEWVHETGRQTNL